MRKLNLFFIFSLILFPALAQAKTCIDDNRTKCAELGFTKGPGGCGSFSAVACPYDPTKWYCAEYTCEDGRYTSTNDTTYWSTCKTVWYKNKNCWDCQCADTRPNCAIGDIFFSDGTCSDQYGECLGKIPVGVVYMLTDAQGNIVNSERSLHGRVINLKDLKADSNNKFNPASPYSGTNDIYWGLFYTEIPNLQTFSCPALLTAFKSTVGSEGSSAIYDGKGNTAIIAATTPAPKSSRYTCDYTADQDGYYTTANCAPNAANATLAFYPHSTLKNNSIVGAGHWYLPSIGEFAQLYGLNVSAMTSGCGNSGSTGSNISIINNALQSLANHGIEAAALQSGSVYYQTSTNYSTTWALALSMNGGGPAIGQDKKTPRPTRASLEFHNIACTSEYSLTTCPENATCSTCKNGKKKIDSCIEGYEPSLDGSQCEPAPCKIGYIYYADGTCSAAADFDGIKTPVGIVYMLTDEAGNSLNVTADGVVNYDVTSSHGRIFNLRNLTLQSDYSFDPAKPYTGTVDEIPWGYLAQGTGNEQFSNFFNYLAALEDNLGNESKAAIWNNKVLQDNILNIMLPFREEANKEENCPRILKEDVDITNKEDMLGYAMYCTPSAAEIAQLFYPSSALQNHSKFGAGKWYVPTFADFIFIIMTNMTENLENSLNDLQKAGIVTQNLSGKFLTLTESSDDEYIYFYQDFASSNSASKDKPAAIRLISFF